MQRQGRAEARPGRVRRAPGSRNQDDPEHEVLGLLPDGLGLHPLRQGHGHSGGPGPRVGGRQPGQLRDGDHRHRPAAIRPAVRALPQSRARQHARHRRGFLHEPPRRGDPVRHREVRPRAGGADHHVQYAGRARGHQGRGPRAGSAASPTSSASPRWCPASLNISLQEAIDQEPGFNEAAQERSARRRCAEGGAAPGRPGAQLLGARRRRGDLAASRCKTWCRCTRPTATKLSRSSTWAAWKNSSCSRWISWG